jgi:hypothetical protein
MRTISCLIFLCAASSFAAELDCKIEKVTKSVTADASSREAAHKGFTFLAKSSKEWTAQHSCFGCHVQAVTMEALTAAKHFQYDVNPSDIEAMKAALKLGVTAGGRTTGVAFEGAAWAQYDKWINNKETQQLLNYAAELVKLQAENGSVPDDDRRLPITGGTMQTTYQAAQTWRQAYARTADDKWVSPMRKAERFLVSTSAGWKDGADVYVQDINFALLGLTAAGVSRSESSSIRLQNMLLARQNKDGGFGLSKEKSDAFATGQSVYALRTAGFSQDDAAVAKGIKYLISQQSTDGSWRTVNSGQHGSEKGETMWAVLGLVTVDVASISVVGIVDGQRVEGAVSISAKSIDDQSGGIKKMSVLLDDVEVKSMCADSIAATLDAKTLSNGKHVVDVLAWNAKGAQSRRRFEVFAGDTFMTQISAQFDETKLKSVVSLRNLANEKSPGNIKLTVFSVNEKDEKPLAQVFSQTQKGISGGMQFEWDGKNTDKKLVPKARYLARVEFIDEAGKTRQTESTVFLHDSEAEQRKNFAEVEGSLSLQKMGGMGSSNTVVELVDKLGNVVQSTTTTEQGNYRFKNVKQGDYKVRTRKGGYESKEADVQAAPAAAPVKADFSL